MGITWSRYYDNNPGRTARATRGRGENFDTVPGNFDVTETEVDDEDKPETETEEEEKETGRTDPGRTETKRGQRQVGQETARKRSGVLGELSMF